MKHTLKMAGAAVALALFPLAAMAVVRTNVFQQGLDGYDGASDTWVASLDWDTPPQYTLNYGRNASLMLSRDAGENPLLRFDLASVPSNSAVLSVELRLYNLTGSARPRRIEVFRVLKNWDEGNRIAAGMTNPGARGATGVHAFEYFPGEGSNVPWAARGMAAGADFTAVPEFATNVLGAGWASWDVTAGARAWVRGESPNRGLTLRDATGYEDGNPDGREFVSAQSADTGQRPCLVLVYNPDTPWADAGADVMNWQWDGGPVALDGSGSHDRPGGSNATLRYAWRVARAAFGSALGGTVATQAVASFAPDVAGEWELELTVVNDLGESATDRVVLRLYRIPAARPRIFLTPEKLAALRARAVVSNLRWVQLKAEADDSGGELHAKALVGQILDDASYREQAVQTALRLAGDYVTNGTSWSTLGGDVALVYDWCHDRLDASRQDTFIRFFTNWLSRTAESGVDLSGWGNYWPRFNYSFALAGLATYGDTPRATDWLDEYRLRRVGQLELPLLDRLAEGGVWPEGMIYDWIANLPRLKASEAWRTAAGENLFLATGWYRSRLGWLLMRSWPGVEYQWGHPFHPYASIGDSERHRGSMANYGRIMGLILIERFPDEPLARQLQGYLAAPPADESQSFESHDEFLWFNPAQPAGTPSLRAHYAPDAGALTLRSGWPAGAADTNPAATHIAFQCGDHFTYHQHYDQNGFTLFKHGDLLADSGVYSGDGRSWHDINYYVRTIAHNTLVVFNPSEDFSAARPDASSNDGGQRTMYPASRYPGDVAYFDEHRVHYDTGEIAAFEDAEDYAYARGDATKAYNNPAYFQALDTALTGNTAKVTRFVREFVYLRPAQGAGPRALPEFVVLYDRVGVTASNFSGANTKLLFHTLNEPAVEGAGTAVSPGETLYTNAGVVTADSDGGRLFLRALLPERRHLRKVGGRGVKAFWAFDANYDWHWAPTELQPRPTSDFDPVPYGEWRLELEPADTALDHNFLTVLHPASTQTNAMPEARVVRGGAMEGVWLGDSAGNRVALFSAAADGAPPAGAIAYRYPATGLTWSVLFDLPAGARYRASASNAAGEVAVTLTPDAAGSYTAGSNGVLFIEDNDFDTLPDRWEASHGLSPANALGRDGPAGDFDNDRSSNRDEWIAGTDPADPKSFLGLTGIRADPSAGAVNLRWTSASGRVYAVERSTILSAGFTNTAGQGIAATAKTNAWPDTHPPAAGTLFYRVRVE